MGARRIAARTRSRAPVIRFCIHAADIESSTRHVRLSSSRSPRNPEHAQHDARLRETRRHDNGIGARLQSGPATVAAAIAASSVDFPLARPRSTPTTGRYPIEGPQRRPVATAESQASGRPPPLASLEACPTTAVTRPVHRAGCSRTGSTGTGRTRSGTDRPAFRARCRRTASRTDSCCLASR